MRDRSSRSVGRASALVVVAVAVVFAAPRAGHADEIDPTLEATLHLKVLSFDDSLDGSGSSFVIAVVVNPGERSSQTAGERMTRAFNTLGKETDITVHGRRVRATTVSYSANLDAAIGSAKADVVYVAPGLTSELSAIAAVSARRGVPTLAGSRFYAQRGVAVAVFPRNGKPRIAVNVVASKRARMSLDPKLMRLAEVIR